jgi:hypothetical protein
MKLPALESAHRVAITCVSRNGIWVTLDDEEVFLPFEQYPWFKDAPLRKLLRETAQRTRAPLTRAERRSPA